MSIKIAFLLLWIFHGSSSEQFIDSTQTCITSEEQELANEINAYRKSKKLPPIPISTSLSLVAKAHVADLRDHFERGTSCNPHSWSDQGTWTPCCYKNDGKEAACMWSKPRELTDYPGNGYEIVYWSSEKVENDRALSGWKKSKAHNQVIVNLGMWKQVSWSAMGLAIGENYAIVWFGQESDPRGTPLVCNQ